MEPSQDAAQPLLQSGHHSHGRRGTWQDSSIHSAQPGEILESFEDTSNIPPLSSDIQTVVNIVNLYMGIGLLSIGFAIKLGGWMSLVFLAGCSFVFSMSAKLLTTAFDKLPASTIPSYPNLGFAAAGHLGHWLVMVMALAEFFGAICVCLIVFWHSLEMLLPLSPICIPLPASAIPLCLSFSLALKVGTLVLVVPAVWIRSFSRLTSVASSGIASSFLLTCTVVAAYAIDPSQSMVEDPAKHTHKAVDTTHLPLAVGIFLMSFSGHAGLPSLRRSMAKPQHFDRCVSVSFLVLFLVYSVMGITTYAYFGDATRVLVTQNLTHSSSLKGLVLFSVGSLHFSINSLLNLLVTVTAFSKIPPLTFVVAELLLDMPLSSSRSNTEGMHQPLHHSLLHHPHSEVMVARSFVVISAFIASALAYNVLDRVESIVGGVCSVAVSLLLPTVFFQRLHRYELETWQQLGLLCMLVAGVLATTLIALSNMVYTNAGH